MNVNPTFYRRLGFAAVLLLAGRAGAEAPPGALAVGAKIPPFEALDQNGTRQTFDSIKGAAGAVLLFHRSADW
jgi:hypothetical protein